MSDVGSGVYNNSFFKQTQGGSLIAARKIIPHIFKIFQPNSVIDIGCGVGAWLRVFKDEYGVKEILGVDGEYVNKTMLQIDKNEFISFDLKKVFSTPRKFDMAMCLEVGEHLPDSAADNLVQSLTDSSDFIVFSAAIPGQTGTYHINEQYPEYWAKKFIDKGYICIDHIRKEIWNIQDIDFWYRQNIFIYIRKESFEINFREKLGYSKEKTDPEFITRVHPDLMLYYKDKFYQTSRIIGFLRYHLYPLKKLVLGNKKK